MEIKAKANHLRISPRKVRLIVDVIRGLNTTKALEQLKFVNKAGTGPIEKLVRSAIANAVNNFELDENNLYIKEITVDEGKTLKRWMPRAHGRATPIRKRTSHVDLSLAEIKDSGKTSAKKQEIEAPVNLEEMAKKATGSKDAKKKDDKGDIKESSETGANAGKKGFASKVFRRKSG